MGDETKPPEAKPVKPGWKWRILGWWGIVKAPERRWGVRLKFRFYLFTFFAVFIAAVGGLAAYSTSPSFCRSCHIMEPYYQAWANSRHKDVACVECHYPPGETGTILWKKFQALSQVVKYVTRTYSSKPYAEVEDASCLRGGCHSTRLLHGRVITEKGVLFDHRPHLEGVRYGRQLRCASCHSQIVVGKHIEVTWDTCYLCHLKGRKDGRNIEPMGGCLGCHTLPDREINVGNVKYNHKDFIGKHNVACQSCHQDVIQGDGDVPKEQCLTCHNQPEKIGRYKETDFLHANHVTKHNTACFHCHREMRHGATTAGTKSMAVDCKACHVDTHDLQRDLYRGIGARGVPPMPSPMYLTNVDCVGCHIVEKKSGNGLSHAETWTGTEQGCKNCHGDEYKGILDEVHLVIRDTVAKLKTKIDELAPVVPAEEKTRFEDARHNLRFVELSHAVHNIYFAASILRSVDETLDAIAAAAKTATAETAKLPVISGMYCATLCHSKVGVNVPPEKVTFRGKEMPHNEHVAQSGACVKCHTFGGHKEVRLKDPAVCLECHDAGDLPK